MFLLYSPQSLRVFDACYRLGSFTLAAEYLGMTQGAVSQHIKNLEIQLGFKLFDRCPRGVNISASGEKVLNSIKRNLENISHTIDIERMRSNQLHISVHVGFAALWLLPNIADFNKKHTHPNVSINVTSTPTDFTENRSDISIEYTHRNDVVGEQYVPEYLVPVCSPSFAEKNGLYLDCPPESLLKCSLIGDVSKTDRSSDYLWSYWAKQLNINSQENIQFQNCFSNISIQMAELGFGVALGRNLLISDAINDGRLVALSSKRVISPFVYSLIENPNRKIHECLYDFKNWFFESI
ncbi:Glycine cleavage system transcriptional activator (plasmid) [Vibrio scophthalmi]|uniref:LysR family transcriptional regulator n=1 Tax=Vibrio scophthalmi TaxID=45658 RepID=UPI0008094BB4|nr:LysR family transcriptional regulator [Vibrio scophthalmi]ANS88258.1 Glycine cleavage system transcriptional activator [Vibrio scophthalmi]